MSTTNESVTGNKTAAAERIESVLDDMAGASVVFLGEGQAIEVGALATTRLASTPATISPEAAAYLRHPQVSGDVTAARDGLLLLESVPDGGVTIGATLAITDGHRELGTALVESFEFGLPIARFTPHESGMKLPATGLTFGPVADGLAAAFALFEMRIVLGVLLTRYRVTSLDKRTVPVRRTIVHAPRRDTPVRLHAR